MQLKNITGIITLLTGTKIGTQGNIEIGGNDNPTVRNPLTNEVYIPGSSIKGKMRSLLEWQLLGYEEIAKNDGRVHTCKKTDCPVCRIFGRSAGKDIDETSGPTRLIVRDAFLSEKSREKLKKIKQTKGFDTEIKYENSINRLSSEASPRNSERIPAGVEFEFSMSYKVIDEIDKQNFDKVLDALRLVELDGIGGGVSRGNGQVKFEIKVDGEKIDVQNRNI